MLVAARKKHTNLFNSIDYQNAGPKMNFLSVFTQARYRCFVTSEYVTDEWLWSYKQCIQLARIASY